MAGRNERLDRRDPRAAPAPDLVRRKFAATAPNRLWLADIAYVKTDEGFLHLAFLPPTPGVWWAGQWRATLRPSW